MIDPIAIQVAALRSQVPDLTLRPGQRLVARLLEQHENRGLISLAGATLVAELPDGLEDGQRLRLRVDGIDQEKVVLRLLAEAPAPVALPLPGEAPARLRVDDESGGEGAERPEGGGESIALVYDTPQLGPLHLRLELDANAVRATIGARAGEPFERAETRADELREALARVTGREAAVTVRPRREPLDVYA